MTDFDFENPAFDQDDVEQIDDDEAPFINPPEDTWEAPNETPPWADGGVPAGISQEELASTQQTEALIDRWRRERGKVQANLEFASSTKDELWLRWGRRWLLLTNKNRPGEFLAPATLKRYYGADITKALGIHESIRLSRQAAAALQTANEALGEAAAAVDTVELQDLRQPAKEASDAIHKMETTFTEAELDGILATVDDPPINLRELRGLDRALQTIRGELTNNLAKLTELDEHITMERRKLDEAEDEFSRRRIAERLRDLQDERASRLEAATANREALRSQINRMRETINRILNEDTTLAERIRTLFREQGITIVSILTAIGMAISTLVLALTGGGGGGPSPAPAPSDKGGLKEWVQKHLQSLGRVLAKLAGKAAAALPGIIGSIVSWVLNLLSKTADWLAQNLWAVALAVGSILVVAAREWLVK